MRTVAEVWLELLEETRHDLGAGKGVPMLGRSPSCIRGSVYSTSARTARASLRVTGW